MSSGISNDGIYIAFFTGEFGTSLGIFLFKGGVVCGADLGSGVYDGSLLLTEDAKYLIGTISFRTTQGGSAITGASSDLPVSYETSVKLSLPVDEARFHEIQTLAGPINVRFQRVRPL